VYPGELSEAQELAYLASTLPPPEYSYTSWTLPRERKRAAREAERVFEGEGTAHGARTRRGGRMGRGYTEGSYRRGLPDTEGRCCCGPGDKPYPPLRTVHPCAHLVRSLHADAVTEDFEAIDIEPAASPPPPSDAPVAQWSISLRLPPFPALSHRERAPQYAHA